MSLQARVEADLKQAMLERDDVAKSTLRMLLSALKNRRIELGKDLEESEEVAIASKAAKQRQESIEQFTKAGRTELAEREALEAKVLDKYLPQLLGEAETRVVVEQLIKELGISEKKELGKLMKGVMAKHRNQIDGKLVQRLAAEILN